jgi:hypothetical protein
MTNEQLSVLFRHLCRDVNQVTARLSLDLISRGISLDDTQDLLLGLTGCADTLMRNAEELMSQRAKQDRSV